MTTKYSSVRPEGREHIPLYPRGFIAIRIVQLVLALMVIGLAAYGVSIVAFDGNIFIMVVGLFTLIISVYHLVAEFGVPNLFNYWAVLALDIFLIIMWLSSFALLASEVSAFFSYYAGYSFQGTDVGVFADCMAAATGLGGAEFLLFIISLAIHSVSLHRHRAAGLHCTPGAQPTVPGGPTTEAKPAAQAQVYPTTVPNPAYTQAQPQAQPQGAYAYQQQQPQPVYVSTPSPQPQQMYAQPPPQVYAPVHMGAEQQPQQVYQGQQQQVDPNYAYVQGGQQPGVYQQQ